MQAPASSSTSSKASSSSESPRGPALRSAAILVHRYVGLAISVFLLVAGLTGSVLVFHEELDTLCAPQLRLAEPPQPDAAPIEPFALRERIQAQLPAGQHHNTVYFEHKPGRTLAIWVQDEHEEWRQVFVDPYTGKLLGSRRWGDLSEGAMNLIPFIYSLHYSLALGSVGSLLFGLAALLWTLDCFVGAYITFPTSTRRAGSSSPLLWLRRWMPAWLIKTNKLFSFVFTWHRASGLWLWALLLVFAWSAVGLNLRSVYQPVMTALTGMEKSFHDRLPELEPPFPEPGLSMQEAHALGQRLMAEQAAAHGFSIERELFVSYADHHGAYVYSVESSLDVSERHPGTEVYFDAKDGHFIGFDAATGVRVGNTISTWLFQLHFAWVGGLAYRIFVMFFGVLVAALSVSGIWIWWRKRSKRSKRSGVTTTADVAMPAPAPGTGLLRKTVGSPSPT